MCGCRSRMAAFFHWQNMMMRGRAVEYRGRSGIDVEVRNCISANGGVEMDIVVSLMRKNVEKQLLLDGQFCKPYPVAHVKFRRVQVPGWLNQGLSMSTFVRTREMVVNCYFGLETNQTI